MLGPVTSTAEPPTGRTAPTALRGRLVLPDRILDDGVVEVAGDRLGYVGESGGWAGPAERVGTVVPGFVDVHCHGGGGRSVTTGVPEDVAAVGAHHLARGTTTMLASLVTATPAGIEAAVAAVAGVAGPRSPVAGSHLEGPFLGRGHCGAHEPALLAAPDEALVRRWLDAGAGSVRMLTLAPELPGADAVAELLDASGVLVAAGHTDADAATFGDALRSPAVSVVTHLFNGMAPMHHREPGPVAAALAALVRGDVHVELIADGIHLADETVAMVFDLDRHERVVLVSDAMAAAGTLDGDYLLGGLAVTVRDGVARTGDGTIAGSTVHLADAVRRCVTGAGVDPVRAVRAATATPAALLGLSDRGRLASGLRADVVTVDDDWAVTGVLHGGVRVA